MVQLIAGALELIAIYFLSEFVRAHGGSSEGPKQKPLAPAEPARRTVPPGVGVLYILLLSVGFAASAERISYRNAHPIGWMHMLPVGETPGWSGRSWINTELNHANIWNMNFAMTDRRTGDVYTYKADFEQSSAIASFGFALSEKVAISAEVPYANHNGGFLDAFIDQFHQVIGSERFLRHMNEKFGNAFEITTNGQDRLATIHGEGIGSAKAKLKYWLWRWISPTKGVCDCGMAVSAQAKFPTQRREIGLSSGGRDYSGLFHLGAPIGKYSGAWATAAFTKTGQNDVLQGWPRREWLQMYELSLDLGLGASFGVILQARTESPILMKEHLDYNYTAASEEGKIQERVASGWNSLVEWRGSQAIGFRWRWGEGSQVNVLFVEDWGVGKKDGRGDWLYVNNAPDIALLSQWHFVF